MRNIFIIIAVCLLPVVCSFYMRPAYPYVDDGFDYGGDYDRRPMTGGFYRTDDYMDGHPLYDRDNVAVFPGSYHPGFHQGIAYPQPYHPVPKPSEYRYHGR